MSDVGRDGAGRERKEGKEGKEGPRRKTPYCILKHNESKSICQFI
jgi:hypothetical protein